MNGLPVTEAQFTSAVIELAKFRGWKVCHFRPARTAKGWRTAIEGDKGFPDLVLARDGVIIFAELKIGAKKLRKEQEEWQNAMGGQVYVWRPEHLRTEISDVLR